MQCEKCRQRPATVHMTRIVNGKKSEHHLCAECAAAGQEELGFSLTPPVAINNLLAELLNYDEWFAGRARPEEPLRCSGCGLTYKEFSQTGLLGCATCHHDFAPRLEPLLQRIHGNTAHKGKVPRRQEGTIGLERQKEQLRQELDEAVAGEEYERAAQLRDQIRDLSRKLKVKR